MLDNLRFIEVFKFNVVGRPVPWSAPLVGRRGGRRKNPELIAWQAEVAKAARECYGPREPSTGPIYLAFQFLLVPKDIEKASGLVIPKITENEYSGLYKKQGGLPDRTNLVKGAEDALEGVFFVNDTQVRTGQDSCLWGVCPGVRIMVGFLDPANPGVDRL